MLSRKLLINVIMFSYAVFVGGAAYHRHMPLACPHNPHKNPKLNPANLP
jgi:hypothetical protein